jgi:hypothetical protein
MKLKHALLFGFGLVIALLFVSCQSEIEPTIVTSVGEPVTSTAASQSSLGSITPSPVPSATSTVKVEATLSLVPDPTPSATVVPVTATPLPPSATPTIVEVTLTPLPTLEGEKLELAVAELLANPMDCDVPCWWGAKPGTTSVNDIKHTISPYNFHVSEARDGGTVVYLLVEVGYLAERDDYEIGIVYNFSDSILTGVTAISPPIFEVLTKYGQPDEIWLSAMNDPREAQPTIWFNMLYFQAGMGVNYVIDIDIQDNTVMGCFGDERIRRLRLITPNSATSYEDFSFIFGEDRRYLSLEEATGLTLDTLMQVFSDPINPQCIETPAELWE